VPPIRRRPAALLAPLLALPFCLLATGCGGAGDGSFDAQSATPSPSCREHQRQEPGIRYTGRERSDPGSVLEMMRYYTANGTKAYCDGRPATATDRRWTALYRTLGGDPAHVPDTP
jgi:hypothetical protein